MTTVKKTQKKETSKTAAKKAQPVKAAPKKDAPKKAAPKKEVKAPVNKAAAKVTVKKTVAKKPVAAVAKKVEEPKKKAPAKKAAAKSSPKKVEVKEPKQPESTLNRKKIKPSSVDVQRPTPVSVTTERPSNVGMDPSGKRRLVVSYDKMKEDVAAAFKEKYPKGYQDYMADLFKVDKPDGTSFYAITLETDDALYLIKMVVAIDRLEDAQKSLFPDADASDDIPTEGETFPDDNTENMSDSDDDSE